MTNRNEHFWTQYYHTTTDDICEPSSFAKFVYEQYIEPETAPKTIADLGCGNCRDSRFFSNTGNVTLCYAIDPNLTMDALKWSPSDNLILVKNNAIDGLRVDVDFNIVYMRWFLHAIPYSYAQQVFECAVKRTKTNGRICVEVRSLKDALLLKESVYDEEDKSYTTTHKRWPFSLEMLRKYADLFDCQIVYEKEDFFSPNPNSETSNPLLIRIIFQKN